MMSFPQSQALEYQTSQVFDAFCRAVRTYNYQDAVWAAKLFEPLAHSLRIVAKSDKFMHWSRETPAANSMDRFLLQYAIAHLPALALESYVSYEQKTGHAWNFRPTNMSEAEVRAALANNKLSYEKFQQMTLLLAQAGRFDCVLNLFSHIRENCKMLYQLS